MFELLHMFGCSNSGCTCRGPPYYGGRPLLLMVLKYIGSTIAMLCYNLLLVCKLLMVVIITLRISLIASDFATAIVPGDGGISNSIGIGIGIDTDKVVRQGIDLVDYHVLQPRGIIIAVGTIISRGAGISLAISNNGRVPTLLLQHQLVVLWVVKIVCIRVCVHSEHRSCIVASIEGCRIIWVGIDCACAMSVVVMATGSANNGTLGIGNLLLSL
mmetsp:Transcript_27861/g.61360  ORF Transcript_27861/g.61360 Transcript_27861/m.61360 type:complete len:215 (+) Transcript_27861:146-790(+)